MDHEVKSDGIDLVEYFHSKLPAMLERLEEWVSLETPSADKPRLDRMAGRLQAVLQECGLDAKIQSNREGGDHVLAGLTPEIPEARRGLVLAHFDTVWPVGVTADRPFRISEGKAWGPGVYDMKASLVQLEFALRALQELGLTPRRPIRVLMTSDEETGSHTSRAAIESAAKLADWVLVVEPPLRNGALKTARKGIGQFKVEITGRAAHAGVEPEKGISAVKEMAHQVLRLDSLNDLQQGTTVNCGVVHGGSQPNVVPARAEIVVDVRAWTLAEADRVTAAIRGLSPVTPGASVAVSGGLNRPPMERSEGTVALFEKARDIGRELGLTLEEGATGGGSDGNFTAALGVPTLDGLGIPGDGAHAEHEQIEIGALPARTALLTRLLIAL